ncbi:tail assembly chaperone [Ileibacterium valens]|uniref:tail assembly chaperone n=1 Tax=Ileibacterium valens TaxID=1862668 RepID=UPI0024B90289|nr:tail assembly chaperone [Ileibacterium valens]
MEITIKDKTYPLKASFAFLREMEIKNKRTVKGDETMDFGLADAIIQVREVGDLRYLVDLLAALNIGQKPRLEKSMIEAYLEDECEDIESLIDEVLNFLYKANVCRLRLKKFDLIPTQKEETKTKE